MTISTNIKTFKDKRILLPRFELAWEIENKILRIRLGIWKWDAVVAFNF